MPPKQRKSQPRHLVTTAIAEVWNQEQPNLFLGEWCRPYRLHRLSQQLDLEVMAPYGLGQATKDNDHHTVIRLEESLSPRIYSALNRYHDQNYAHRSWHIIVGHWLRRFLSVVLNRYRTIDAALNEYAVSGTTALAWPSADEPPRDSQQALWMFSDDYWNHRFYLKILAQLSPPITTKTVRLATKPESYTTASQSKPAASTLRKAHRTLDRMLGAIAHQHAPVLIGTYLPIREQIATQVLLGHVPRLLRRTEASIEAQCNIEHRHKLSADISTHTIDPIEAAVERLAFQYMPVSYLEGFADLQRWPDRVHWPKKPSVIFTSNNFDTDDAFKAYVAAKVTEGSRYIVGQHGNNYGTHRYLNPSLEETTADMFLTWGWTDGLRQHVPAFAFTTSVSKGRRHDPSGGLLLLQVHQPHRIETWDTTYEFRQYQKDQLTFIEGLRSSIAQATAIRLHPGSHLFDSGETERWTDAGWLANLSADRTSLDGQIRHSRLLVFSYDSTGILESLANNIPTIAFWRGGFEHVRDSAIPFYETLTSVGIIQSSAEGAADAVNELWLNLDAWWNSHAVQSARTTFISRYAKPSRRRLSTLHALITKETDQIAPSSHIEGHKKPNDGGALH